MTAAVGTGAARQRRGKLARRETALGRSRAPAADRALSRRAQVIAATAIIFATVLLLGLNLAYMHGKAVLDLSIYRCYAHGFWHGVAAAPRSQWHACTTLWHGSTPARFHALPAEYPAPALLIFSLPLLTPWWSYATAFELWMALPLLLATAALAWRGRLEAAAALPIYCLLAGWLFAFERYDLLPGLCVMASLLCLQDRRYRWATVALAAGTVLKGFPILLFPLVLLAARREEQGRWRTDLVALFAAVCAACLLPALLLDPGGTVGPLHYELARPLHIESLPGGLLWFLSSAGDHPHVRLPGTTSVQFTYNSLNIWGGPQAAWGGTFLLAGLAGIAVAYRRAWRGEDTRGRSVVVLLLLLLAAGKVFSPQYLLWLLPAVAVVDGLRGRWLLLCLLTAVIIDYYFNSSLIALPWTAGFTGSILLRNALLLGFALLYLLTRGDTTARHWPTKPLWRYIWYDYLKAP